MPLHNPLLLLRAITGGKASDTTEQAGEPASVHQLYPITTAAADARFAELYKQIDDLRADRDAWREQTQRLALPPPPRRRWWSRAS